MDAAFLIQLLRNDLLYVLAKNGRIVLTPKGRITDRHRELVRQHREALLEELAKWPGGAARPRDYFAFEDEPVRADERGSLQSDRTRLRGQQPKVVSGRKGRR